MQISKSSLGLWQHFPINHAEEKENKFVSAFVCSCLYVCVCVCFCVICILLCVGSGYRVCLHGKLRMDHIYIALYYLGGTQSALYFLPHIHPFSLSHTHTHTPMVAELPCNTLACPLEATLGSESCSSLYFLNHGCAF